MVERDLTGTGIDADDGATCDPVLILNGCAQGHDVDVRDLNGRPVGDIPFDCGCDPLHRGRLTDGSRGHAIDVLSRALDDTEHSVGKSSGARDGLIGASHQCGNTVGKGCGARDDFFFASDDCSQTISDGCHTRGSLIDPIDERLATLAFVDNLQADRGGVTQSVSRAGEHVAVSIEEFDHRVERGARIVDVDPDFAAAVAGEAINVRVGAVVVADRAVNLKAEAAVIVATHFLS